MLEFFLMFSVIFQSENIVVANMWAILERVTVIWSIGRAGRPNVGEAAFNSWGRHS